MIRLGLAFVRSALAALRDVKGDLRGAVCVPNPQHKEETAYHLETLRIFAMRHPNEPQRILVVSAVRGTQYREEGHYEVIWRPMV